jgi:hypothetical protein
LRAMFPHWCKRSVPKRQTNLPLSFLNGSNAVYQIPGRPRNCPFRPFPPHSAPGPLSKRFDLADIGGVTLLPASLSHSSATMSGPHRTGCRAIRSARSRRLRTGTCGLRSPAEWLSSMASIARDWVSLSLSYLRGLRPGRAAPLDRAGRLVPLAPGGGRGLRAGEGARPTRVRWRHPAESRGYPLARECT